MIFVNWLLPVGPAIHRQGLFCGWRVFISGSVHKNGPVCGQISVFGILCLKQSRNRNGSGDSRSSRE